MQRSPRLSVTRNEKCLPEMVETCALSTLNFAVRIQSCSAKPVNIMQVHFSRRIMQFLFAPLSFSFSSRFVKEPTEHDKHFLMRFIKMLTEYKF